MVRIIFCLLITILTFDFNYAQNTKELTFINDLSNTDKEFKISCIEINKYLHKNNRDTNLFAFIPVYITKIFLGSNSLIPFSESLTDSNHNSICEVIIILKKNYKPVGARIYCRNRFSHYYFGTNRYSCMSTLLCSDSYTYLPAIFYKNLKNLIRKTKGDVVLFSVNNFLNLFYVEKHKEKDIKILKYRK